MVAYTRILLAFLAVPLGAVAQCACPPGVERCLCVDSWYGGELPELIIRVITFLSITVGAFCTVAFLIGAFLIVVSRGQEPLLPRGKSLIIDSLIGMAVVLGAQGILRLVVYVLYSPA